jgi:hypothetical protein
MSVGEAALKGALAGVAGGAAMMLVRRLEERGLLSASERSGPEWATFLRREARHRGIRLTKTQSALLGSSLQLSYSALIGAAYGVVRSRTRIPRAAQGLVTGALVHAANLPAWGLIVERGITPRPLRQRRRKALIPISTHAVFGVTTVATFKVLARGRLA